MFAPFPLLTHTVQLTDHVGWKSVIMAIAGTLHIKMEDVGKKKKKRPPVRPGSKGSQASKQVL